MKKQVDVLLATYNGEAYLHVLMESLLHQTYKPHKIIVRDDGSKDRTRDILQDYAEKYPSLMKLLPVGTGQGSTTNFSELLKQSTSDYVMFADQDDLWIPEKIELTMEKMEELERENGTACPLLVHTDLIVADQELKPVNPSFWNYAKLLPKECSTLNRLLVQNVVTGCTLMMNRALVDLVQPISPQTIQHDWWIALVAAAFGKIDVVEQPTIYYRQHSTNAVGAKKFNIFSSIVNRLCVKKEIRQDYRTRNYNQALAFGQHYGDRLDNKQRELVAAYCETVKFARKFKRLYLTFRYGFYKNGFSRNVFSLFS